jgi:exopolysaccharide/PEP-CTERM locus tyrosine autokinase
MLTPDAVRSRLAEEYRLIKRPLLMNAFGKGASVVEHPNLIMITSALPGEGKTFSSINLAMSIAAELDHTVVLVDADVARPAVARVLGIEPEPGLIDVLVDEKLDLSDVLIKTDVEKLSVIPSGHHHPQSTELLASEHMRRITTELSQRYSDRIVIFDSPPLLVTSEASVLANLMGQVVLVVESEHTPQSAVKDALGLLHGPEILGFILNKSIRGTFGGDYYYTYGDY